MKNLPLVMMAFLGAAEVNGKLGIPISGRVVYADGGPAAGAKVVVTSDCRGAEVTRLQRREVATNDDGSFTIPSFDSTCSRYQLIASFEDQYWLQTADQIFSLHGKRIPGRADIIGGLSPRPLELVLDERGGRARFRVRSEESKSFIHASLTICRPLERVGDDFHHCPGGSLTFGTGDAGEGTELLLPEGSYILSARQLGCWDKPFTIAAGSRVDLILTAKPCALVQQ